MNKISLILILCGLLLACVRQTTTSLAEEIKTIDGDVIEGKVVSVDEDYLAVRQESNHISFLHWDIVSYIIRKPDTIIVSHTGGRRNFLIFTATGDTLSARESALTMTDAVSSLYPGKIRDRGALLLSGEGPTSALNGNGTQDQRLKPKTDNGQEKQRKGNIDAGLTLQTGNTESVTTSVKTNLSWERIKDNIYFSGLMLYETQGDEKNIDEQRGSLKYEFKHWRQWYSFYQESLERDEIERLNVRSITSAGFGYRFIETKKLNYKTEIGPSFTFEKFTDNIQETDAGLRIGNYLDWNISPSTAFYGKADFLPVPYDLSNWRLESDVGVRHNVTKSLSLNVSWMNDYDNAPSVAEVDKNDTTILSAIGYNF